MIVAIEALLVCQYNSTKLRVLFPIKEMCK